MVKRRRSRLALEAERANTEQLVRLGRLVRAARLRRRLTQARLGERVGVSRSTVSALERGLGGGLTLDTWQRVAVALDQRLRVDLPRDPREETADAGHLATQELVLRVARAAGWRTDVELPSRPAEPWRSVDVALRSAAARVLVLVECWNTIGDVGAAARSTSRKVAELAAASAATDGAPYRVASCWVVRASRRNRDLVRRYPHVFAARFPGSSRRWAAVIADAVAPPGEPGLVWCDPDAGRLFEWRAAPER